MHSNSSGSGVDLAALCATLDAAESRLATIEQELEESLADELRARIASARSELNKLVRRRLPTAAIGIPPFWRDLIERSQKRETDGDPES